MAYEKSAPATGVLEVDSNFRVAGLDALEAAFDPGGASDGVGGSVLSVNTGKSWLDAWSSGTCLQSFAIRAEGSSQGERWRQGATQRVDSRGD